jgi:hypothetical protein
MEKEQKSLKARVLLISNEIRVKKDGTNDFSKYDYFTPDGILTILNPLLLKYSVFTQFVLIKNENTYTGKLYVSDTETGDSLNYELESPEITIKGANPVQALGGLQTYLKRYLLMNAFNIADNKDDYDSNAQQEKKQDIQKKTPVAKFDEKKLTACKTKAELSDYFNSLSPTEHSEEVIKKFTALKEKLNG